MENVKTFSSIKVYPATIHAYNTGFNNAAVKQHPLAHRYMKGSHSSLPVTRQLSPTWDLSLVLEALL